jgi:DNA gyrase subunit A
MKTTPRIGKVMQVLCVGEEAELVIITQNGKMIRIESSHIRQAGRSTQGVKLVSLEEGDRVAAASVIPDDASRTNGSNGSGELPLQ